MTELADGSTAFVKAASDLLTAGWLRVEHLVYSNVQGSFLPRLLGWHEAELPLLALEDLSDGHWPLPWPDGGIEAVRRALDALHAVEPPPRLPRLARLKRLRDTWQAVAEDPDPFLSLGLVSRAWLESSLPVLREAALAAPLDGTALLHLDVRSDNVCLRGDEALLVDWNWACVGNPDVDLAA